MTMEYGKYRGQSLADIPADYIRDVSTWFRREYERLVTELGRRDNEARQEAQIGVLENRPVRKSRPRVPKPTTEAVTESPQERIKRLVWEQK